MGSKRNSMFYGALLLTAGSIAMRLVQLIFQVYISGIMGAAGLGRMHLIMTVGGFAAILASGGVRIAATCLAAEEAGRDNPGGVRTAICCCGIYGLMLSVPVSMCLWALAPMLSLHWVSDASAVSPIRIQAVFLPVGCLWAVLAGYYTAAGRITELVALELVERVGSVGLVVALMRTWVGISDPCAAVFLGSGLATTANVSYLYFLYRRTMKDIRPAPARPMLRRLLHLTVPLGFNDVLRSGLSTLEHLMIPQGLRRFGASGQEALAAYGTIGGMVFPVITFPSVILYSLSDLLVPEMARSRAKDRKERIIFLTDKCLRLSVFFAAACSGLCFLLGDDLGLMLFDSPDAGRYIRVFAPLILILYLDAITDGILKGLSQQIHSVRYNTFTSLLDVGMLFVLLPRYGIGGYLAAYTVSRSVNFFLSLRRLILVTHYLPRFHASIGASLCCACSFLVLNLWPQAGTAQWALLRGGGFLLLYLLLIRLTGLLSREDLHWLKGLILQHKEPRNSKEPSRGF